MWQAMAANIGSQMLSGEGGGLGGLTGSDSDGGASSAESSTSTSVNFTSGPFGATKDLMDYLPLILVALILLFVLKKG